MNKEQIDKFYDMVCLYEYVGELTRADDHNIEVIQQLYGNDEFSSINVLFNEEGYELADEVFVALFGVTVLRLNELADEFGFARVGEA